MMFYIKYKAVYIKTKVEGSGGNNNNNNDGGNNKGDPLLNFGGKYIKIKRVPTGVKKIGKGKNKKNLKNLKNLKKN